MKTAKVANWIDFDPRHPVDPQTGAEIWSGFTQGFKNRITIYRAFYPLGVCQMIEARLKSLTFFDEDGDPLSYGEREIREVMVVWGGVKLSNRCTRFYMVFGTVQERDKIRWKLFNKPPSPND